MTDSHKRRCPLLRQHPASNSLQTTNPKLYVNQCLMKTSRTIQFVVAALLLSAGCLASLSKGFHSFAPLCFCLPPILTMTRTELTAPVHITFPAKPRQRWLLAALLFALLAVVILLQLFVPSSVGDRLAHCPALVIPLWALYLSALIWRWRYEWKLSVAGLPVA